MNGKPVQKASQSFFGAERSPGERSEPGRSGAPKNDSRLAPLSTEVSERPTRRRFTTAYKLAIVEEADRCDWGQIGAMLRREGLYHSHLDKWRRLRDEGGLDPRNPRKRGRKPNPHDPLLEENKVLRRENARLQKNLGHAKKLIDIQKKISALLDIPLNSPEENGSA